MEYWTELEIGEYGTPSYQLIEVCLECEMKWENDGIGSYEYWGFRGYDKGTDYVVCEDMKVISKHDDAETAAIEEYLRDEENWKTISEAACEKYEKNCRENDPRI